MKKQKLTKEDLINIGKQEIKREEQIKKDKKEEEKLKEKEEKKKKKEEWKKEQIKKKENMLQLKNKIQIMQDRKDKIVSTKVNKINVTANKPVSIDPVIPKQQKVKSTRSIKTEKIKKRKDKIEHYTKLLNLAVDIEFMLFKMVYHILMTQPVMKLTHHFQHGPK